MFASRRAEGRALHPVPAFNARPSVATLPDRCPECNDVYCPEERCLKVGDFYKDMGRGHERGAGAAGYGSVALTESAEQRAESEESTARWELISPGVEDSRIDLQVCMCLDVTSSMSSMLDSAKRGLKSAWSGIQKAINDERDLPSVAVICYQDYADQTDANGDALQFTGKGQMRAPARPKFDTDKDLVHTFLQPQAARGGGDIPEMVEFALAAATVLPWKGQIQTLYLALDAPPHCHGVPRSGCCGDNWPTVERIRAEQRALLPFPANAGLKFQGERVVLELAVHPECWMTQAIILARLGVIINPMICTTSSDVVFFAAFLAELTGGQAVFLDNSRLGPAGGPSEHPLIGRPSLQGNAVQQGDLLENYVKEYTSLEIEDVRTLHSKDMSAEDRAQAEVAHAEALLSLPEKYEMRVPGKEVSEAISKLFKEERIKEDLVFNFPGKGIKEPVEEEVRCLPNPKDPFVRLPGFDSSAFCAASKLLPKYNRALAEAVEQNMGVVQAEHMREYNLSSLGGVSRAHHYMETRSCARGVQQFNFGSHAKMQQSKVAFTAPP